MLFIVLTPFSAKRLFLLFAAATCLSCVTCLAQPNFFAVKSTPYDNQMVRIRPVLQHARTAEDKQVSLRLVNHWIENLRTIPYGFSTQWKTPSEVESGAVADCKGKAVALYEKMRMFGASNLRLVIGRRSTSSRSTHAWLEWTTADGRYLLDPTLNWRAFKANEVGSDMYVPFYAYSGDHKFCATNEALYAKN